MKSNKDKKLKQTAVLFTVTFLVSLVIVTYFIKSMSPNVDVEIGGEDAQQTVEESSDSDIKQAIDDRLRWIQMEDNMPGVSKREENQNQDEDITYMPSEKNKDAKTSADSEEEKEIAKQTTKEHKQAVETVEYVNPKKTSVPPVPAKPAAEPFKMSKVYVGSYPTIEQAIQAQNKLMSSPVSVSPFVKEVNGSYVLQAGSYASAGKAEAVSREISSVGFHARVVQE